MLFKKVQALIVLIVLQTISFGLGHYVTTPGPEDRPCHQPRSTCYPPPKPNVLSLKIYTDIKYRYATTVVTSTVENPADVAQEVSFTVVIPDTAFISGFLMVIDERVYKAYVKEKEEAESVYGQARDQGQSAALVELSARNSNLFTVSVNVEPHKKIDFNLTYEELLIRTLGYYSHVININPGQIVSDMLVNVKVNESARIIKVDVPVLGLYTQNQTSHPAPASIEMWDPKFIKVNWSPSPEQQRQMADNGVNGQVVLKYDVDRSSNPQQILVDGCYFIHFFAPESLQKMRKHVTFVLDYSGSMDGRKVEQLIDAMVTILEDLDSSDYFSLVLFSNKAAAWYPYATLFRSVEEVTSGSVLAASEYNKRLATDFLKSFNTLTSTNIIDGLRKGIRLAQIGIRMFSNEAVPPEPMIIFLTDGLPNVEIYNTEDIFREVELLNTDRVSIYSLGFGSDADMYFLRKLSLSNKAFARNIYEASDAALQLKNFYEELSSPVLRNISFNYLPGQVDSTLSSRVHFPEYYYNGSELVVVGRLHNTNQKQRGPFNVGQLVARASNGTKLYPINIEGSHCPPVPGYSTVKHEPSHLENVWAYLTIRQLLDNIITQKGHERNNARRKALDLALQHSFITPLTSLVVVKPDSVSVVNTEHVHAGEGAVNVLPLIRTDNSAALQGPTLPTFTRAFAEAPRGPTLPTFGRQFAEAPQGPTLPTFGRVVVEEWKPLLYMQYGKCWPSPLDWLMNYTAADGTITLPISNNLVVSLKLAYDEPNTSFGSCQVHGMTGTCHHINNCEKRFLLDSVEKFLPYRCDIPSGFLGMCCVEEL